MICKMLENVRMGRKFVQILMCALIGLLDIGRNSFSAAALIDKKDLIDFDNISLGLVEKFIICDKYAILRATAMHGRIYAVCDLSGDIRVFDSTTYQRLDDIVVDLDDGYIRHHISSCPYSKSLFLVYHSWGNFDRKEKVLKINVTDNSQSVWMTMDDSDVIAFSISPFDGRLIFTKWKSDEDDKIENTIEVYDQEGLLVKTVPMPLEIEFPNTVLETNAGTYLVAEDSSRNIPYVLKHLDRNGKMLETLLRDDNEHNKATSKIYVPKAIAVDSLGYIYGTGTTGEVLVFDQAISRNRVIVSRFDSDWARNLLYDDYTDRVLVYMPYRNSMAAYAIRINVTCNN